MKNYDEIIHQSLNSYYNTIPKSTLKDAIVYALKGTGKRLRPKLMLSLIESHNIPSELYGDLALSLELVHTYSLVHDDLPAMDNDDLRRGKPTTHIAFDEATAILVGDALLSDAFRLIVDHPHINDVDKTRCVQILSSHIGSKGMVYGQILDIESENQSPSLELLLQMNELKTARLLQASLLFAGIITKSNLEELQTLGYELGLLYQIQDDLLEQTTDSKTLGKSKSDERRNKPTIVSKLGFKDATQLNQRYINHLDNYIQSHQLAFTDFDALIKTIVHRTY